MSTKSEVRKAVKRVKSGAEKAGGAILGTKSKIKGVMADSRRGGLLWNQGYGASHDSKLKVAKAGKKVRRKRPASKKIVPNSTRVGLKQIIKYKRKK